MIGETKGGKGKAGMANVILTDDPGDAANGLLQRPGLDLAEVRW